VDVATLRVVFTAIAAILLVLFLTAAYRPTRAPFSGWWTATLLLFLVSGACYLADGTAAQRVLNPLGNGFGVAGAQAAWCAARSLRTRSVRWPFLLVAPVVSVIAGALGDPAHDTWSGGLMFLLLMGAAFSVTAVELVVAGRPSADRVPDATFLAHTRALAVGSVALGAFYVARAVAFVAAGRHSHVFVQTLGSVPTTMVLIVQLVIVSFSMSSLSTQQQLRDLRHRAVYDGLTGLLRAQEFRSEAESARLRLARAGRIVVLAMADLDHFKKVNDELGHATGDAVLRAFGLAAGGELGPDAVCGRIGGEEFAMLFTARDLADAERRLDAMIADFQGAVHLADGRVPTVSMGLVVVSDGASIPELLDLADRALYRAKATGRSRTVRA